MDKLLDGHRAQARGDRHRPPAGDRRLDPRRARAARSPSASQRAARGGRRPAHLAQGRHAVGRPRRARDRQPPRLADGRPSRCSSTLDDLQRVRRRGARRGLHRRRAARHGRLVAGARGDPPLVRRHRRAACGLHVLDSTDAGRDARASRRRSTSSTTLFVVSSKSGGTIETLSLFKHFHGAAAGDGDALRGHHRPGLARSRSSRREHGFRRIFLNDPDIGGRYSALSYFGLVPAALHGRRRRRRCSTRARRRRAELPELRRREQLAACGSGSRWASWRSPGRDKLTFVVDPPLESFGLWVEQLDRRVDRQAGQGHPAGRRRAARRRPRPTATTASSLHLRNADAPDEDADAKVAALRRGRPPGDRAPGRTAPTDLGRIFFFAEFAIAVAGWVLEINPFDQPNVQEAKDNTARGAGRGRRRTSPTPTTTSCARCSTASAPPRYLAIMGYLAPSRRVRRGGRASCARRSATRTNVATTFGYGPRFLHSTGPAAQGRPADRALPAARPRRRRRTSRSPARATASRASSTRRRSATSRRCATTACRPSASRSHGDDPAAARAGADRAPEGAAVTRRRRARPRTRSSRGSSASRSTRRRSSSSARPATSRSASCCRRSTTSPTRARCPSAST